MSIPSPPGAITPALPSREVCKSRHEARPSGGDLLVLASVRDQPSGRIWFARGSWRGGTVPIFGLADAPLATPDAAYELGITFGIEKHGSFVAARCSQCHPHIQLCKAAVIDGKPCVPDRALAQRLSYST